MENNIILIKDQSYLLKNGLSAKIIHIIKDYFSNQSTLVIQVGQTLYTADEEQFRQSIQYFPAVSNPLTSPASRTLEEKVRIYRSYFKGREDIVADSFKNDAGKMVYYPYCLTRKRGNCPKINQQRFECSKCQVAKFQPLTAPLILQHFAGRRKDKNGEVLYGLYPMLKDNTVWLLAIDFDDGDWKTEIKRVITTSKKASLTPLIERSQSGNGAHLWFFFQTNISARKARQFGSGLLRQTMLEYPDLSFSSFDRFFPSQDELSVGGFGNLIALPLQGNRVLKGNSLFLKEDLEPVEDMLGHLAKTPKLSEEDVDQAIALFPKEFNFYKQNDNEAEYTEINLLEDSNPPQTNPKILPVTIDSEIRIPRSELEDCELAQLKSAASFYNPQFFKNLKRRLSTRGIPKIISCARLDDKEILLPRGLLDTVIERYPNIELNDQRLTGRPIDVQFIGDLYPAQQMALSKLEEHDNGILMADTGFGKTVVAAKLISDLKVSTLILVNNQNLAKQWKDSLSNFLEIYSEPLEELTKGGRIKKKDKIGKIFGGTELRSRNIDIALFQSLSKKDNLDALVQDYGMVIVDEAHHTSAFTFEEVLRHIPARYIYGLSATPKREDGLENIEFMQLGPIRFKAEKEMPLHIRQNLNIRFTSLGEQDALISKNKLHDLYGLIVEFAERNEQIVQDILDSLTQGRHIIVLTQRIGHIDVLAQLLKTKGISNKVYILNSTYKKNDLTSELESLKNENDPFVLLTTGSYAGEGFDLPTLDTLILAMPYSGKNNVKQFLGRLTRNLEQKTELRVYDYVDYAIPMLYQMYLKRMRTYKKLGYQLFTDDQTTLYKSDLYEDYLDLLISDLKNSQESVIVILPSCTSQQVASLTEITFKQSVIKTLIVPYPQQINRNYRQKFEKDIARLSETGFAVRFTKFFQQKFILIDHKFVWILPNSPSSNETAVAARMVSRSMAEKLLNYFSQS